MVDKCVNSLLFVWKVKLSYLPMYSFVTKLNSKHLFFMLSISPTVQLLSYCPVLKSIKITYQPNPIWDIIQIQQFVPIQHMTFMMCWWSKRWVPTVFPLCLLRIWSNMSWCPMYMKVAEAIIQRVVGEETPGKVFNLFFFWFLWYVTFDTFCKVPLLYTNVLCYSFFQHIIHFQKGWGREKEYGSRKNDSYLAVSWYFYSKTELQQRNPC